MYRGTHSTSRISWYAPHTVPLSYNKRPSSDSTAGSPFELTKANLESSVTILN